MTGARDASVIMSLAPCGTLYWVGKYKDYIYLYFVLLKMLYNALYCGLWGWG